MTTPATPDRPFTREAAESAALYQTFEDAIEKAFLAQLVERSLLANGARPKELRAAQAERTGKVLIAMHAAATLQTYLHGRIAADEAALAKAGAVRQSHEHRAATGAP